jgi:hypothetical protein
MEDPVESETDRLRPVFEEWVSGALAEPIPGDVSAFCFNLFESADAFGMELIGAPSYAADNQDRACDELFAYRDVVLELSPKTAGRTWQQVLAAAVELVRDYVRQSPEDGPLRRSKAVAVGFVDGDLEVVWP